MRSWCHGACLFATPHWTGSDTYTKENSFNQIIAFLIMAVHDTRLADVPCAGFGVCQTKDIMQTQMTSPKQKALMYQSPG